LYYFIQSLAGSKLMLSVDRDASVQNLVLQGNEGSDMQLWQALVMFDRATSVPLGTTLISKYTGLAARAPLKQGPVSQALVQDVDEYCFWDFHPASSGNQPYVVIRLAKDETQNLKAGQPNNETAVYVWDWEGGPTGSWDQSWLLIPADF
jgi:hypothetical protein